MKTFECSVCGHIEFDEIDDKCLVCSSTFETFSEGAELKSPADPANLTDGVKKHIPQIVVVKECGLIPDGTCTDVHVRVGEIEHVMTDEHHIRYLDYYVDHRFVSRVWLAPNLCHPAAALHLNVKSGTVTAIENCNQHGSWMTEVEI